LRDKENNRRTEVIMIGYTEIKIYFIPNVMLTVLTTSKNHDTYDGN